MTFFVLFALAGVGGCVERSRERTADEEREVRRYVSKSAPSPAHALGASFDGKIELVGFDVSPEKLAPGKAGKITWHWKVIRPIGDDGWRLFTHVHDAKGAGRMNLDDEGTIRRLYPPSDWKAGEYVRDEQRFDLEDDWDSDAMVFYVGIWKGEDRLPIRSGPHDSENRVQARVPTESSAPLPLPRLRVPKATAVLEADGALDEPDWARAVKTGPFVNTMTGKRLPFSTEARILWTDEALWIGFDVGDRDIHSTFHERDSHLWEQDVVEVFLDPGGDARDYYELQVSPRNVQFDSHLPRHRKNRNEWNSRMRSGVRVDGTLDDDAPDRGWTAEMAIPWADLTHVPPPLTTPPSPGAVWRANLFRMEWRAGSVRGAGWSPPRRPDFHALERFGEWEFVDEGPPSGDSSG